MNRSEQAKELFKNGYNCSQSVVGIYSELFGMNMDEAMRAAEGFGGGMGRLRLTCGAVSGMAMLAGIKYSKSIQGDVETRKKIYEKVREMVKAFEEKHGTVICGELLGKKAEESARPDDRTEQYYKKRPCLECIEDCANIIEKFLVDSE